MKENKKSPTWESMSPQERQDYQNAMKEFYNDDDDGDAKILDPLVS